MPLLIAFGLCLALTPVLARLGLRWGLVDRPRPDGLKIHTEPKPVTGGVGVVAAALAGTAVAADVPAPEIWVAILLMLVVGVIDDVRTLPPLVRLIAQFGAGAMLAVGGLTFPPLGELGPFAVVLSVPLLTNAMNIVDGQDGLASGLALVGAAGVWAIAATQGIGPAIVGALMGFLLWNRPPASVFLGDGGAYAVGCLLAVLAATSVDTWESLLGTVLCLGVFALELVSTVLRRVAGKRPLLGGDRSHVYDRLATRLGSRERATAGMLIGGVVVSVFGWLVAQAQLRVAVAVVAASVPASWIAIRRLLPDPLRRSR
jgi:UDP-GlcNAc:undecaprenyl-phosphate GlcNAc-1-phosphate transferase